MALWQYTFIIAPARKLSDFHFELSEAEYDSITFWNDEYDTKLFDSLTGILPKSNSWSEDILLLGKEDSNCIEIILRGKKIISEVILRIDFRKSYASIVDEVLDFCILNNLMLLDEGLNIQQPNSYKITQIIESSPQYEKFKSMASYNSDRKPPA